MARDASKEAVPFLQRVSRSMIGSKADPERFGAALALSLFFVLGLVISWDQPWSDWAVATSAYYFVVPLTAIVLDDRFVEFPKRRLGFRIVVGGLLAGMLLILYPAVRSGDVAAVLSHGGTFFFAGAVIGALLTAVWARPSMSQRS